MTTETTPRRAPMAEWQDRATALIRLQVEASAAGDLPAIDALAWAITELQRVKYRAQDRQRFYDTRHFCGLCYREIAQGAEQSARGQNGHYHGVCAHLLSDRDPMPAVRKALSRGTYEHLECLDHKYRDGCPILDGGEPLPAIGEKRAVFAELRGA